MAKSSKIAKNDQRREVVARYAGSRAELKMLIASPHTSDEARGYVGAFGLSRINLRTHAHAGHLPGVRKSSW
ncbi:small subunit ribosomal protein S14 [Catenulispora sp. GAS73]|uniref:30S ribosomal protein S14 n=1 Tax=Catenulispora sp. GAS73 TaxID=3156269 RepID=UPI003516B723